MNKSNRNITSENYFYKTFAIFVECKWPHRSPDFTSDSGSKYWYGKNERGDYVIRLSDHWTRYNHGQKLCRKIASCQWQIISKKSAERVGYILCGKCYFKTFVAIK